MNNLIEAIAGALSDKNPNVLINAAGFLGESVRTTYIDDLQDMAKDLISPLLPHTNHMDGSVWDASLEAIGVMKGRLGESFIQPFIKDLNGQKLEKVNASASTITPTKYDQSKWEMEKAKKAAEKAEKAKKKAEQSAPPVSEDALMEDAFDAAPKPKKKKKGPPAGFLQRQQKKDVKKEEPPADEPMEEVKQPADSGSAEPPKEKVRVESKNPNMKEEDFNSAQSKEEAQEILEERVGKTIVALFSATKW